MAKAKTFRLRDDQADWLAQKRVDTGLRSENQVMEFLIDHAMTLGWPVMTGRVIPGGGGGWISGPSQDVAAPS